MPTEQDMNSVLSTYGINLNTSSFSFANIMAWVIFGIIGMCAFNYGRKEKALKPALIGLVLMIYPYFVSNTIVLYVVGVGVSLLLYFWKD
jgi:ABC-type uncharacterized transport system permease subunit